MFARQLHVLAVLSTLFIAGKSYTIDDDCGADTDFVRERINAGFELANVGLQELEKRPVQTEIDHVFEQLFGYTVTGRLEPFQGKVETYLRNVYTMSTEGQPPPGQLNNRDVRFYCTTKRIKKRADGRYYNDVTKGVYPSNEITNRFASCFELTPPTLAITTNPSNGPSEIQICPWFLTQARGWKFTDFKSFNSLVWGGLSTVTLPVVARAVYAPIDSFHLMDKVILHELTHTETAGAGLDRGRDIATVDMGDPGSPYGWKNCKGLAEIFVAGDRNNPRTSLDPQHNADSIAILCSAIQLILRGVRVDDDGKLDPPQRNTRRDVVMYPVTWIA